MALRESEEFVCAGGDPPPLERRNSMGGGRWESGGSHAHTCTYTGTHSDRHGDMHRHTQWEGKGGEHKRWDMELKEKMQHKMLLEQDVRCQNKRQQKIQNVLTETWVIRVKLGWRGMSTVHTEETMGTYSSQSEGSKLHPSPLKCGRAPFDSDQQGLAKNEGTQDWKPKTMRLPRKKKKKEWVKTRMLICLSLVLTQNTDIFNSTQVASFKLLTACVCIL